VFLVNEEKYFNEIGFSRADVIFSRAGLALVAEKVHQRIYWLQIFFFYEAKLKPKLGPTASLNALT